MELETEIKETSAGDDLPLFADLNDDGFPAFSVSSIADDVNTGDGDELESRTPPIEDATCDSRSFAADFFSSGTDWSCLVEKKESRNLVQRDLFQMWGVKKPAVEGSRPKISSNQRNLWDIWGIEKTRALPPPSKRIRKENGSRSGPSQPRACPFYKKISGSAFLKNIYLELQKNADFLY